MLPATALNHEEEWRKGYCYYYGVNVQSDLGTATVSDLLCVPIWFLIIPTLSTRALWQLPTDTSSRNAWETWQKKSTEFVLRNISLIIVVFVNIAVKSDNMGPSTLLPVWRNSCYGFLSALKIHRPRPGLNPRILAVIVITLPVGHQGWRRTGWWRGFPFRISSRLDCLLRPSACAHENGRVVPLNGPLPALSEFDPSYIIIVTVCKIVVLDFTYCLNYTV
jgi:hypothetical protein